MTTQSISESAKFPIADARSVWHEVRRALHGQGTRLITVVATMVVGAALGLVPPWALGRMVDASSTETVRAGSGCWAWP